jgi:hypothetical protein
MRSSDSEEDFVIVKTCQVSRRRSRREAVMLTFFSLVASLIAASLSAGAQTPAAATPGSATPSGSRVWLGRYAEYEDFLRTAEIERVESFKVGITGHTKHVFFKPGGLVSEGAMRDQRPGRYEGYFESYKSEAAAYKMDRLLEMDMVPPAVERTYDSQPVTVQLFVKNVKMLKDVNAENEHDPDGKRWNRQVHRVYLFDDLVADIDENQTNLMFDPEWSFIKIDCSRCFTDVRKQPFEIGKRLNQIDRPFFERVKALDKAKVAQEIGSLVEVGAVDALMRRRDDIVKAFDKLAHKMGEAAVFVP